MGSKRRTSHYYVVERAPKSVPCSEDYCRHYVVAGVQVVCLVTRYNYSWKQPDKKYKCPACSKRFLRRIKAAERAAKKR